MFEVICVTGRNLCTEDFLEQLEQVLNAGVDRVILREKDLSKEEYRKLAIEVLTLCRRYDTSCVLHSFCDVATELGETKIHLPIQRLREMSVKEKQCFTTIGVSCHSAAEAVEAQKMGAAYLIAGHIFETDCKKGLPAKGLPYLEEICRAVTIPVYAIGGIDAGKMKSVEMAGAKGACLMSGLMTCRNVEEYLKNIRSSLESSL